MPFTEDKIIIKRYRSEKGYGRKKLLEEFPNRDWTLGCLGKLLKKFNESGSVQRKAGSGRLRTVRTKKILTEYRLQYQAKMIMSRFKQTLCHFV